MSSAQLDIETVEYPLEEAVAEAGAEAAAGAASELRQQVAARLAAHRERRTRAASRPVAVPPPKKYKTNAIAETVAARYAQSTSYRAFLAEEARRAIEQAAAAAEIAARNAQAVALAQFQILDELERWDAPQQFKATPLAVVPAPAPAHAVEPASAPAPGAAIRELSTGGLTVRLYEDVGRKPVPQKDNALIPNLTADPEEVLALDDEIAFRQSPVFEYEGPHQPPVPIPANLLEFPRQLVATKKARPRLAEGPLREEAPESGPDFHVAPKPQLRIFEVEAAQSVFAPEAPIVPEWTALWLDAPVHHEAIAAEYETASATHAADLLPSLLPPQTAGVSSRLMAATVDAALVFAGFLGFTTALALTADRFAAMPIPLPAPLPLGAAALGTLVALHLGYHLLFFTFADATPGMRYARIGLCTFNDENPTRSALRRRILATIVATCPLGLGLLWALLDDDRLGWHDRISRMYQRSY